MNAQFEDKKYSQVTIYYDGLCRLCSREINTYKKMKGAQNLHFVDITSTGFDAKKEGLDPIAVHKAFHVRDQNGNILVGVDGFICIWQELPTLRFLVPIANKKPIHYLMQNLYSVFAIVRPYLPRKKCQDSPYCEVR